MNKILKKTVLNPTVVKMDIYSPLIAKKAKAGQFIILRANENSERIPLTIADSDAESGSVTIIFQLVGASTKALSRLCEGEYLQDFAGPLGNPTELSHIKKACVVGGGVGCAIAFPVAKALYQSGKTVDSVIGFRTKSLVILEDEFRGVSNNFRLVTDDGSYGEKGLVTDALRSLIENKAEYDEVFAIGPLVMMKFVCALTKEYGIKTTVSMNSIMIDGTGMCGCCRLTVGGKTKFACVDGPDFDGHEVDFDEAINRSHGYSDFEKMRNESCNLFKE